MCAYTPHKPGLHEEAITANHSILPISDFTTVLLSGLYIYLSQMRSVSRRLAKL